MLRYEATTSMGDEALPRNAQTASSLMASAEILQKPFFIGGKQNGNLFSTHYYLRHVSQFLI